MRLQLPFLCIAYMACYIPCFSQEARPSQDKLVNFPSQYLDKIESKSVQLENQLQKSTDKYINKLSKQEDKIIKKLQKIDSAKAQELLKNKIKEFEAFRNKLTNPNFNIAKGGEYLPYLDSIKGTLNFLKDKQELFSLSKVGSEKISVSLEKFNSFQSKLGEADYIKQFIRERRELIKNTLSQYSNLPKSILKNFDSYNKEFYYYSQQIKEYRDLLNNPDKLALRALSLLNKLPAFTAFMNEHSELAGLFSIPSNYSNAQGVAGLQTTSQVQQLIQNQIGSGSGAQAALQQNLQAAQAQLNSFKDKINKLGGGSGDIEMPKFTPNNLKSKTFWKRLEYSTNMQSVRSNYFFPSTTDLGLSIGYRISEKGILGVGISYKMGWGRDIQHISISNEGIGLRSFIDIKAKGSFFATGGFEYNYQKPFNSFATVYALNDWQQSGLLGVTKIISLKTKVFKKTKVQLLWDFLSYNQRPVTTPIKFRVGYNF